MPNARQSGDRDDRTLAENESAAALPTGNEVSSDALRRIVEETVQNLAQREEADPCLKSAIQQVARLYAGQPITVDPVGTALLEAVLREQLPVLAARPALLAQTARIVASKLLSDPAARLRVEHLWATLAEDEA